MSYAPTTDFLTLARLTSGGVRTGRTPGLDYLVAALVRMGLFSVYVGQAAPAVNQSSTAWLKPSYPQSWAAEGQLFLWNVNTAQYEPATPELWSALFAAYFLFGYVFQSVTVGAAVVNADTSLLAVQRAAPANTVLTLPPVASRGGRPLQIVDWSSAVVNHQIRATPDGISTIMRQAHWDLFSTADQLSGITLYPSTDLSGWIIAP